MKTIIFHLNIVKEVQYIFDDSGDVPSILLPCVSCNRTFRPEALAKHSKVCEKTLMKKQEKFDSSRQRIQGTLAEFLPVLPTFTKKVDKSPVRKIQLSKNVMSVKMGVEHYARIFDALKKENASLKEQVRVLDRALKQPAVSPPRADPKYVEKLNSLYRDKKQIHSEWLRLDAQLKLLQWRIRYKSLTASQMETQMSLYGADYNQELIKNEKSLSQLKERANSVIGKMSELWHQKNQHTEEYKFTEEMEEAKVTKLLQTEANLKELQCEVAGMAIQQAHHQKIINMQEKRLEDYQSMVDSVTEICSEYRMILRGLNLITDTMDNEYQVGFLKMKGLKTGTWMDMEDGSDDEEGATLSSVSVTPFTTLQLPSTCSMPFVVPELRVKTSENAPVICSSESSSAESVTSDLNGTFVFDPTDTELATNVTSSAVLKTVALHQTDLESGGPPMPEGGPTISTDIGSRKIVQQMQNISVTTGPSVAGSAFSSIGSDLRPVVPDVVIEIQGGLQEDQVPEISDVTMATVIYHPLVEEIPTVEQPMPPEGEVQPVVAPGEMPPPPPPPPRRQNVYSDGAESSRPRRRRRRPRPLPEHERPVPQVDQSMEAVPQPPFLQEDTSMAVVEAAGPAEQQIMKTSDAELFLEMRDTIPPDIMSSKIWTELNVREVLKEKVKIEGMVLRFSDCCEVGVCDKRSAASFFSVLLLWLGKQKSSYRLKTAKRTDERIRLMNEIINGISVIKMYTWEKPFEKLVAEARRLEIKEIRGSSYITGIMLSFLLFNNRLAIFCSIVTYVLMGNLITASIVYVVTDFFTLVRQMMSDFFPLAIGLTAEILVSIKRIETFLLYNEMRGKSSLEENGKVNLSFVNDQAEGDKVKDLPRIIDSGVNNSFSHSVILKDASAKWSDETFEETLSDINIEFPTGKLTVVIGPVGSGKSSILQTILKELPLSSGFLHVSGSLSYAAQEPWLFEGSVRQNILFGSPYNETRYRMVVRACALRTDLEQLPHGDQTLVGDRGVVLSGGQRARINMARAVYREADIYLLDDPLSAVDTHVSKHLFEQCISGYLKSKTVILVTHQLQFLASADHIVLLSDGKVITQGSYQALRSSGTDFSKMIVDNKEEEEEEESNKEGTFKRTVSQTETTKYEVVEEVEEMRTKGTVSSQVFHSYMTAGGHWTSMMFLLLMFCLTQFIGSAGDYWLNYWVNLEEYVYHREPNSTTLLPDYPFYLSQTWCIVVFTLLIGATIIVSLVRSFLFFYMCMRSSMWLHNTMFASITRATMRFFHTNPSGRILNRFTKDMGSVDELLPSSLLDVLQIGLVVIGIVGVLVLVNAWLLIPTFIVACIFYFLRNFYLKTSRGVKRLEGITRSPVVTHLNASLHGLTTIRAFSAEAVLEKEFDSHQDLHSSAFYIFIATARAFGYWLDVVCSLYIAMVTFSFLIIDSAWLGGSVGLAITQTVGLIGMFQWGMKQSAEVENFMTSVERILEYTQVDKEPPLESPQDKKPPANWPTEGEVEFNHVVMSYDPSLPPVLKDVTFVIRPREKVGVVGRTGAGKSSLTAALFRFNSFKGKIIIDGIDVTDFGLHDLRSKLSVIPQEPVLFSGNVRKNLDPFDEYSDHTIWSALEEVELKEVIEDLPLGLNSKIVEGGANLSVGQRQLMCLARAIVRNNKILVLDEATANVDLQTDALIQKTIRRKFAECTVLTIAHRLNTVMDSDKILVMSNGCVVEFDHPHILLGNKHGYLYRMVEQLGRTAAESLHNIAALNYNQSTVLRRPKSS